MKSSVVAVGNVPPRVARCRRATWLVCVAALVLGVACKKDVTAQEKIRVLLEESATALNQRDSKPALALLDDSFVDGAGRKRDQFKQFAMVAMMRDRVLVGLRDVSIAVDGDNATATLTALVLMSPPEVMTVADLVPTNATSLSVQLKLHASGGKWSITSAHGDGFGGPAP